MTAKLDTALGLLAGARNTLVDMTDEAFMSDRPIIGSAYEVYRDASEKLDGALADLTAYKHATQSKD